MCITSDATENKMPGYSMWMAGKTSHIPTVIAIAGSTPSHFHTINSRLCHYRASEAEESTVVYQTAE